MGTQKCQNWTTFEQLPDCVWRRVFALLPLEDLWQVRGVSKALQAHLRDYSPFVHSLKLSHLDGHHFSGMHLRALLRFFSHVTAIVLPYRKVSNDHLLAIAGHDSHIQALTLPHGPTGGVVHKCTLQQFCSLVQHLAPRLQYLAVSMQSMVLERQIPPVPVPSHESVFEMLVETCTNLRTLKINDVIEHDDDPTAAVPARSLNLREFHLTATCSWQSCCRTGDAMIGRLVRRMPLLTELNIVNVAVTPGIVDLIGSVCPLLERFHFGCDLWEYWFYPDTEDLPQVLPRLIPTADHVLAAARHLPRLRELGVYFGDNAVTPEVMGVLRRACPQLCRLVLYVNYINPQDLEQATQDCQLPQVHTLELFGCVSRPLYELPIPHSDARVSRPRPLSAATIGHLQGLLPNLRRMVTVGSVQASLSDDIPYVPTCRPDPTTDFENAPPFGAGVV